MVRWRIQVSGLLLLAPPLTVQADTPPGHVVGTADGCNLTVLVAGNRQVKVHLAGDRTPERNRPFGEPGKAA